MRFNKLAFVIAFALSAILFAEVAAHADEADQATKLTFSKPIAIPGQVLPAGTYLFKLADENDLGDLGMIRVFNADGTHLYATLHTNSTQRPEATGKVEVVLGQEGPGMPDALLKWFYPGSTIGHEFVYSKHEEQQMAQYRQQTIMAKQTAEAGD